VPKESYATKWPSLSYTFGHRFIRAIDLAEWLKFGWITSKLLSSSVRNQCSCAAIIDTSEGLFWQRSLSKAATFLKPVMLKEVTDKLEHAIVQK
jgi:hypothetical protein